MKNKERYGILLMALIGGIIGGAGFNYFIIQASANGAAQGIKVTPRPAASKPTGTSNNDMSVYNKNGNLIFRVEEANYGNGAQMTFYDDAGKMRATLAPYGASGNMRLMLMNKKQGAFVVLGADTNVYGDPALKSLLRLYDIDTGSAFWTSPTK